MSEPVAFGIKITGYCCNCNILAIYYPLERRLRPENVESDAGEKRMKVRLSLRLIYLILLILFFTVFFLAVGMASYAPYSGRAYVEYGMAPVYSKVAGTIESVDCRDGEPVKAGDPLFRLDTRNYNAEVRRLEALYETTRNKLEALDGSIREEEQNIREEEQKLSQRKTDLERDRLLQEKGAVSRKSFEDSKLQYDTEQSVVAAHRSHLESLVRQRGTPGDGNSELRQLRAELEIARNNLRDATVRAPISGVVSCHQLYAGQAVVTNEKYAVIHDASHLVINADMMEKSAGRLRPGRPALVVFDAIPGRVFAATLKGTVRELSSGYVAPNELHRIEEDTRWIRAVGRTRVQLELTESIPAEAVLCTGSRAAVAVANPSHPFFSSLSRSWIRLIGWLNYVY